MDKKIKLENGFECTINTDVLDDMEFVDLLADTEDDPLKIGRVALMLLGKEQKKNLYDHLRTDDGRVPVTSMNDAIEKIFNALGDDAKN
jgi:hypothetical protein